MGVTEREVVRTEREVGRTEREVGGMNLAFLLNITTDLKKGKFYDSLKCKIGF